VTRTVIENLAQFVAGTVSRRRSTSGKKVKATLLANRAVK